jgi:hypothetical protein
MNGTIKRLPSASSAILVHRQPTEAAEVDCGPMYLTRLTRDLPQPYSWSTSPCIDELDACFLESAADGLIVDAGEFGLALGELRSANGGDADA